ncbi:MAG TPA: nuclease-related domain-containing protein [Bacillota bacterium]|jgi:hypothetical protein|nr:NERD domain-containing protein [Candidatus Fermentithermobacillaceae bacterium]HOA70795.1 nuclease-related domain-containing protein [Bacillota bacterium]HPT35868.1 nuclease-related domain-containing protein [Bacillota bacterium]HPZ85159.1 nuclease-related domain-containing protein [Bacillota bacterium]
MAKMVPDLPAQMIQNDGERMFYLACRDLPDEYTVFYSYKYRLEVPHGREDFQAIGEADFVVVHPELGYVVFEVKQGNIMYANGRWHEFKPAPSGARRSEHHTEPMAKDPVEQAQRAMWAILERYKQKSDESRFPLHIRFALCFPETKKITGDLPDHVEPESIFLYDHLQDLDTHIRALFPKHITPNPQAIQFLIDKVLGPSFKVFALLEDQIQMFHSAATKVLTEEQARILEETELDKKKVFFGAAGSAEAFR